jgi:hypothetical protein
MPTRSLPDLLTEIHTAFAAAVPLVAVDAGASQGPAGTGPPVAGEEESPWLKLPEEVVTASWANRATLSGVDLRQYLPDWLCYALRPAGAFPLDVKLLLELLRLPTELLPPATVNSVDLAAQLQEQLDLTNQALRTFISWMSQLTPAQGRAVSHFLEYVRDNSGERAWSQVADGALHRYWFRYN